MTNQQRIRTALSLFKHLAELRQIGHVVEAEEQLLHEALTALLTQIHQSTLPPCCLPVPSTATYVLLSHPEGPKRLLVQQRGHNDRVLPHVSLFAWRFETKGPGAYDMALAILADCFSETLSQQTFLQGHSHSCRWYLPLAASLPHLLGQAQRLPASRLTRFLAHQEPFLRHERTSYARTSTQSWTSHSH